MLGELRMAAHKLVMIGEHAAQMEHPLCSIAHRPAGDKKPMLDIRCVGSYRP